jgi:hypothetical protein
LLFFSPKSEGWDEDDTGDDKSCLSILRNESQGSDEEEEV